jgi:hypothetical protein
MTKEELIEERAKKLCLKAGFTMEQVSEDARDTFRFHASEDIDWFLSHGLCLVEEAKRPANKKQENAIDLNDAAKCYGWNKALDAYDGGKKLYRKVE